MACSKCGRCCTALFFNFNNTYFTQDQIRYYEYHNIKVKKTGPKQYRLQVNQRCKHLTDDNLCDIFETRPDLCREKGTSQVKIVRMPGCTDK